MCPCNFARILLLYLHCNNIASFGIGRLQTFLFFLYFLSFFLLKSNVKYLSLSVSSLGLGEYEENDGQEEDEDQGEGEEGPGEAERGLQVGVELERGHQQDAGPGPRQALETRGNF